jgi:hypothetical protein
MWWKLWKLLDCRPSVQHDIIFLCALFSSGWWKRGLWGVFFFFVCFPLIVSTKSAPEKSAETMLASALAAIVHRHKHALLTKRVAFRRALLLAPAHRRIHCLESICPSVLPSSIRTTRTASRTSFLSSWSFFKKKNGLFKQVLQAQQQRRVHD